MLKLLVFLAVLYLGYQAYGHFHRQSIYVRLDTSSVTAKTYPREYLQSFLKRSIDGCNYTTRFCEEQTLCYLNKMIAVYTYQQSNAIAATRDYAGTIKIEGMMQECANTYANLR